MFPITIRFGPDGALYVAMPAMGAASGGGVIARVYGMGTPAAQAEMPACTPAGGAAPAA